MITGSQEYQEFLANIVETAPSVLTDNITGESINISQPVHSILKMRLPTTEPIYEVDLNTRKITPPPFIGVEGDHESEYIFFQMDRFYELLDLSESIGIVIFKNAKDEEYYQIIPYYDIYSVNGKIIFPWLVQAPAALYNGTVSFSFKFFKIDPLTKKLIYEINTLIAKTKVLHGWANNSGADHTYYSLDPDSIIIDNDIISSINTVLAMRKYQSIYWIDVDENLQIPTNNEEYNGVELPIGD